MKQIARLGLIGAAALASAPSFARSGGSFVGMGDLPGGAYHSYALAVSADGNVIVGASDMGLFSDPYHVTAARWTRTLGIRPLVGLIQSDLESRAHVVSGDGQSIGGNGFSPALGQFAYIWSQIDGLTIVDASTVLESGAPVTGVGISGLSFDGSVAVGSVYAYRPEGSEYRAFRWTRHSGALAIAGLDELSTESAATAISSNGQFVVGQISSPNGSLEGFRWSEASGFDRLGRLFPNESLIPTAISDDGSVVVGRTYTYSGSEQRDRAFRWTPEGGLIELQPLADSTLSEAWGVSGDGRIAVGWSNHLAVLWREGAPPIGLSEYLSQIGEKGLDSASMEMATAISSDGKTIVGYGANSLGNFEGFIVTLPPHCPGDADRDGAVSFTDISAILTHWQSFGPQGDANDDFIVDFNDITETLTRWLTECP